MDPERRHGAGSDRSERASERNGSSLPGHHVSLSLYLNSRRCYSSSISICMYILYIYMCVCILLSRVDGAFRAQSSRKFMHRLSIVAPLAAGAATPVTAAGSSSSYLCRYPFLSHVLFPHSLPRLRFDRQFSPAYRILLVTQHFRDLSLSSLLFFFLLPPRSYE